MIFSIAQIRGSRSTNITESSNLYYYLFSPTVISDNIFLTASNLDLFSIDRNGIIIFITEELILLLLYRSRKRKREKKKNLISKKYIDF